MIMAGLYREVFGDAVTDAPDLSAMAKQHAETVLHGLLLGDAR